MSWTDERINTLKKMWQSGKSASEIAEKLGGVTRNAVIGKAHRLGLSGRPSPIKKVVKKPAATTSVAKKPTPAASAGRNSGTASPSVAKPVSAPKTAAIKAPPATATPASSAKAPANAPGKPAEIVHLAALANMTSRPDGKLVSILDLTEKVCRWPVGDPKEGAFGYCGSEAYPGHPYCAEHVAIAFQAPNRKDARKPAKGIKADEAPELEDLEVEVEDDEEDIEGEALEEDLDEDDDVTLDVNV